MADQETEKPSEPRKRWVDMDALMRIQSDREDEELLRIWRARRKAAEEKKPKLPNRPSFKKE